MTLASSVKSCNASSALTKDFPPTHTTALVPRPAEIQAFPQAGPRRICVLSISLGLLRQPFFLWETHRLSRRILPILRFPYIFVFGPISPLPGLLHLRGLGYQHPLCSLAGSAQDYGQLTRPTSPHRRNIGINGPVGG